MSGDTIEGTTDAQTFRVHAIAEQCHVGDVRRAFTGWLADNGAATGEIADWALIVSELVANACGASPPGTSIEVDASRHGHRTVLRVTNHAAEAFHPRVPSAVTPDLTSGRGMFIADQLSDGLAYDVTEQVTVTCWKANSTS